MKDKSIYSIERLYYETKKKSNIKKLKEELNKNYQRNEKMQLRYLMFQIKKIRKN
ncbi:hypothetical protein [Oceanivirga salmonicida]|uniref:hypothetical protein n=1 Tax=Oceanivirga salmonicida TaxID=1769291 RepID=UPI0012E0CB37|nr:hypothetical protein [Oceanivirga salmonicida]